MSSIVIKYCFINLLLFLSTEVCNSEEVPEVEIVSLLQEHIPKYRLRADSLTQFGGKDFFPYNSNNNRRTSVLFIYIHTLIYTLLCNIYQLSV